jgi:predicted transport protein
VVPQAKGLRLSLNVDPHTLSDPRGKVLDVTGLGKWGNGDAEVRLDDPEDLPYVMTLVRQSLEAQMGEAFADA